MARANVGLLHELDAMRDRFYGFYLVSCEDIGMATELMPDEHVDSAAAKSGSDLAWLNDSHGTIPIWPAIRGSRFRFSSTTERKNTGFGRPSACGLAPWRRLRVPKGAVSTPTGLRPLGTATGATPLGKIFISVSTQGRSPRRPTLG